MKKPFQALVLVLAVLLASACEPAGAPPEKLIAKSWRLQSLNVKNQPPPPPQIMAQSSFNFNPNGRYEIMLGELERGTWSLSEDKAILITVPDGSFMQQHINISNLTDSTLTLVNKSGASPVTMDLAPL